jgi:hypothetical protein
MEFMTEIKPFQFPLMNVKPKKNDLANELESAIEMIDESMAPYLGHENDAIKAMDDIKEIAERIRLL